MTDYAVTEWRYTFPVARGTTRTEIVTGHGFTSRQSAVDSLCARALIDPKFAEKFVYSIVVPLSKREENSRD
jgi:hypothetical protein